MLRSKLCLEDLSNEIFMEIFDYLYGQHIILSFSRLNNRFNLLCTYYSNYHIDATDYSLNKKEFDYLLNSIYSKHIRSLTFRREQWIRCISIEYLSFLCSLKFLWISNQRIIKEFLEKLPFPHQLRHLSIELWSPDQYLQDLCLTISKFPNLNRLEFNFNPNTFSVTKIKQSLITIKYFSLNCCFFNEFIQLIPFMSNLIGLNLSCEYNNQYVDLSISSSNYLSKLKFLQMNRVKTYNEIDYVLHLCPQLKVFKVNCMSEYRNPTMINAKEWEKHLSQMEFLIKIEINVYNIYNGESMDLTEYKTEFWTKRNITAIKYIDKKTSHCIYDEEHQFSLLII